MVEGPGARAARENDLAATVHIVLTAQFFYGAGLSLVRWVRRRTHAVRNPAPLQYLVLKAASNPAPTSIERPSTYMLRLQRPLRSFLLAERWIQLARRPLIRDSLA